MPKKRTSRIYWRERGGAKRAYVDLRDLGGGRKPLVPVGEKLATTDPDVATKLASAEVTKLEERRRNRTILGVEKEATLKGYAADHLRQKARDGEATERWLQSAQKHLTAAVDYFGAETDLATLAPEDFARWVEHLRRQDNGRGAKLTDSTVRKYLNSTSNLFARALSDGYVKSNPVSNMYSKPTEARAEADFLDAHEAALLLESARTYKAPIGDGAFAWMHPLVAVFLLTGGRKSEVLGLEVDDVSLRLGKVYIRPNRWRRLKTKGSKRTVPLWPQLEAILRDYLVQRERTGGLGSLLFPGRGEGERMVSDVRKALDHIAVRAGFAKGSVRLHMLRHTYTAARIQTLDRDRPVALYTVARELGHRSQSMIEDRYGHLHDRAIDGAEDVSFRIEDHREKLGDRLKALEAATT